MADLSFVRALFIFNRADYQNTTRASMTDSIVSDTNFANTLDSTKAWQSTPLKKLSAYTANKPTSMQDHASRATNLSYAIDRESNALHLKIKTSDGEVIREVVFHKIDLNVMSTSLLKGFLVDDRS